MTFHAPRLVRPFVRRARRLRRRPALALMYHRVAERELDPWGLVVTPDHFAEQLEVIRSQWRPTALMELVEALNDDVPEGGVVVTFDDGYRDNLTTAKPMLELAGVPATIFLATGYLRGKREFWWDELEQIILGSADLPERLPLRLGGDDVEELDVVAHASFPQRYAWQAKPGTRLALYYDIWERLLALADDARRTVLDELAAWSGRDVHIRPSHRPMDGDDVHALVDSGLVSVGAQTVTHPYLPALDADAQRRELSASKHSLEALLDQPVDAFSYPYGALGDGFARDAGFECACTTERLPIRRGADPWRLPRYTVEDWDGDEFARRLQEWIGL